MCDKISNLSRFWIEISTSRHNMPSISRQISVVHICVKRACASRNSLLHFVTVSRGFEPGGGPLRFKEVGNERYYKNRHHLRNDDHFTQHCASSRPSWARFLALSCAPKQSFCPPGTYEKERFQFTGSALFVSCSLPMWQQRLRYASGSENSTLTGWIEED